MPTTGDKIRVMRLSRGWDQQELADKVGVKRNTVSMWENNDRHPGRTASEALADAFNVPLSYIYDNTQSEVPSAKKKPTLDEEIIAILASFSEDEKKSLVPLLRSFANRGAK